MKAFLFTAAFLCLQALVYGQDAVTGINNHASGKIPGRDEVNYDVIDLGLGLGLDYGGIGGNLTVYPDKHLGIFAGFGYALAGVGLNGGVKFRFVSADKFTKWAPFLTAMYGYNAAIVITNAQELNKLFYGPTIGAGVGFRPHSTSSGGFSMGLLVPFRSASVDNYINYLKKRGTIFTSELIPIGITIGYIFILQ
jgi:hypothetical protein